MTSFKGLAQSGAAVRALTIATALSVGLSGCSLLRAANLLDHDNNKSVAAQGERIPVLHGRRPGHAVRRAQGPGLLHSGARGHGRLAGAGWDARAIGRARGRGSRPAHRLARRSRRRRPQPQALRHRPSGHGRERRVRHGRPGPRLGPRRHPGRRLWEVDVRPKGRDDRRDRDAYGGGLAYAGGKLFVTSGYRLITALDARTAAACGSPAPTRPCMARPTSRTAASSPSPSTTSC
ncbi:MAG: hypothetical protein WDN45_10750 [Caulobacteraceae bacterium]